MRPYPPGITSGFAIMFLLLISLRLAACSSTSSQTPAGSQDPNLTTVEADSLGLEAYLQLPASERDMRQESATAWREKAEKYLRPADRLLALQRAVGLNPAETEAWIELGDLTRWVGGRQNAVACLDEAQKALPHAPEKQRQELQEAIWLNRAWINYDLGNWNESLALANKAKQLENSLETKLIYGLGLAGTKQIHEAENMSQALIESSSWGEKRREAGTWIFAMRFFYSNRWHHNMFRLLSTRASRTLRPASRYLDAGLVFENRSAWDNAQLFYEQSITALPLDNTAGLSKHLGSPPLPEGEDIAIPFCVAFDRHFVTGSWYAFAEYAFERFKSAANEDSRQHWALATIEAASVTLRKYSDRPWAMLWRGLAQTQNGRYDLAEADLERALTVFRARELSTSETLAGLGYVKIQREDLPSAENYLQQAVAVDPNLAQAWSYLGYCLVQKKDLDRAKLALDRALKLDASLTAAWYNRGLMHFHAHEWTAAVHDLEEAARLSPNIPDIAELLQRARLAERQANEAIESP